MSKFTDRIMHAWNAFKFQEKQRGETEPVPAVLGLSSTHRPDRTRFRFTNERTIVTSIYTRIAIDAAAVPMRHVRLDDANMYQDDIQSGLNECLTVEANIDQGARHFRQDMIQTLFDTGVIAIVPVDTTENPLKTGGWDINSMRVGKVLQWYPRHVRVRVYDDDPENGGIEKDLLLPKNMVAIVENPLYSVMNEPSSTLQRLLRKLTLLDDIDEQSASGKLDIIIQVPYVVKTDGMQKRAESRRKEIEFQLKDSQYGIAYTDGTEKITQLNRPADNNLMARVEYLVAMLYSQLGITDTIMNGTADEPTMINYYNRSIEPVLAAITEAMKRTFLTKTARSQGQSILFLRDPFKLVPVKDLAEIADKFTRNEVASSNDMRSVIGWRPSKDPKANLLLNKNIPTAFGELPQDGVALKKPQLPPKSVFPQVPSSPNGDTSQNGS